MWMSLFSTLVITSPNLAMERYFPVAIIRVTCASQWSAASTSPFSITAMMPAAPSFLSWKSFSMETPCLRIMKSNKL